MKGSLFVFSNPQCESLARATYSQGQDIQYISHTLFSNGDPNIFIPQMREVQNVCGGAHIVYFSSWSNMEEKKMEEIIIFVLADTQNVASMVVVDPYDSLATMERVTQEGRVAMANVDAHFWKTLPNLVSGKKVHRIIYDHHTLQNRFYYTGGNTQHTFRSALDNVVDEDGMAFVNMVPAFPDDGAHKRFGSHFHSGPVIICGKVRLDDDGGRTVTIKEGDPAGEHVLIVDDLVRTGGTLIECFKSLVKAGATSVSFFVTHAEFPNQSWKRFEALKKKYPKQFGMFYTTDSIPRVTQELPRNIFHVASLGPDVHRECNRIQEL